MCTIMTLSYEAFSDEMMAQIKSDAGRNSDGYALLLYGKHDSETIIRSMNIAVIEAALRDTEWTRMFLHCRFATQGTEELDNTHGWSVGGIYYMHNGAIRHPKARDLAVDSMMIGKWLNGGISVALKELRYETYANVFLIDTKNHQFHVHRSATGSLFTDGHGNYSTARVGTISQVVSDNSCSMVGIPVTPRPVQTYDTTWRYASQTKSQTTQYSRAVQPADSEWDDEYESSYYGMSAGGGNGGNTHGSHDRRDHNRPWANRNDGEYGRYGLNDGGFGTANKETPKETCATAAIVTPTQAEVAEITAPVVKETAIVKAAIAASVVERRGHNGGKQYVNRRGR
jgi:hypothetical protein